MTGLRSAMINGRENVFRESGDGAGQCNERAEDKGREDSQMADRTQLTEAIDNAIRALEELKRVWMEQEAEEQRQAEAAIPQAAIPQAAMQQAAMQQAPIPQAAGAPAGRVCPVCGGPVGMESRFCMTCGAVLGSAGAPAGVPGQKAQAPSRSRFCANCGNVLEPGDLFCGKCRAPVN